MRPGEKLHECMINSVEIDNCYECDTFYIILNETVSNIYSNLDTYLLNYKYQL